MGFRLRLKELRDGSDLILRGIAFQIVGAACDSTSVTAYPVPISGVYDQMTLKHRHVLHWCGENYHKV